MDTYTTTTATAVTYATSTGSFACSLPSAPVPATLLPSNPVMPIWRDRSVVIGSVVRGTGAVSHRGSDVDPRLGRIAAHHNSIASAVEAGTSTAKAGVNAQVFDAAKAFKAATQAAPPRGVPR